MGSEPGTMMAEELTCKELVELVTEYLEGTLPAAERARFDEHLTGCGKCGAYLDQMRQTIRTLGTLAEDSVPAEVRAELLEAFRSWKRA